MSFERDLADAFADRTDAETADLAAERLAALHEDYDLDGDVDALLDRLDEAPDDAFEHAYDWLVGDIAADVEDCTDSREYRLAGYDDLAADPEQGA
jgi:predicted negative regulator of RcsB-dependent stress response